MADELDIPNCYLVGICGLLSASSYKASLQMGVSKRNVSTFIEGFFATGSRPLDYFYGFHNNNANWYMLHGGGTKTTMARDSTVYIGIGKLSINLAEDLYTFAGSRILRLFTYQ